MTSSKNVKKIFFGKHWQVTYQQTQNGLMENASTARRVARNSQWGAVLGVNLAKITFRFAKHSKVLHFFAKNNLILELFQSKIMLLKRGIKTGSAT